MCLFLGANAAEIKGNSSFNKEYFLCIEYMGNDMNKCSLRIPINDEGSFRGDIDISGNTIVRWQFEKIGGGCQLPKGSYLYLKSNDVVDFDFNFGKCTRDNPFNLELGYANNISELNKCLFDCYKNYIARMQRKQENIIPKEILLERYGIKGKELRNLLDYVFLTDKISYRYIGKLGISEKADIISLLESGLAKTILVQGNWNLLVALLYNEKGYYDIKTINAFIQKLKKLDEEIYDNYVKSELIASMMELFYGSFKLDGQFETALDEFSEGLSFLKDKETKDGLIRAFKKMQYSLKGANMPDVSFVDAKGKNVNFRDFKGKFTYVDLWFVG